MYIGNWRRCLSFGVGDILGIALVGVNIIPKYANMLLADPGTGWHIRIGEQMVRQLAVPWRNDWTQLAYARPWVSWSWGADMAMALAHIAGNLHGVVVATLGILLLFSHLLWRGLAARSEHVAVALLLWVATLCIAFVHVLARPHVVAWCCCIMLYLCLDGSLGARRRSSMVFIVMVLWANVHASFILGWMLVALLGLFDRRDGRDKLTCCVVSVVATFLTPYGYHLHEQVFSLLSRSAFLGQIVEYNPVSFRSITSVAFFALAVSGALGMACAGAQRARVAVFVFACYFGLAAMRNVPFAAALMALTCAPSCGDMWSRFKSTRKPQSLFSFAGSFAQSPQDGSAHIWPWLSLGLATCLTLPYASQYAMPIEQEVGQVIEVLRQHHVAKGLLARDRVGSYLIYALNTQLRPLVDDRFELVTDDEMRAVIATLSGEAGWDRFLNANAIDWVVIEADAALGQLLGQSGVWEQQAGSPQTALWHRMPALQP